MRATFTVCFATLLAGTTDLVLALPKALVGVLSFGLTEVEGPGILPASIYFSVCVVLVLLALRCRLGQKRSSAAIPAQKSVTIKQR